MWKLHEMFYRGTEQHNDDEDSPENILAEDDNESVVGVAERIAVAKQSVKQPRQITLEDLAANPTHIHVVEKRDINGMTIQEV